MASKTSSVKESKLKQYIELPRTVKDFGVVPEQGHRLFIKKVSQQGEPPPTLPHIDESLQATDSSSIRVNTNENTRRQPTVPRKTPVYSANKPVSQAKAVSYRAAPEPVRNTASAQTTQKKQNSTTAKTKASKPASVSSSNRDGSSSNAKQDKVTTKRKQLKQPKSHKANGAKKPKVKAETVSSEEEVEVEEDDESNNISEDLDDEEPEAGDDAEDEDEWEAGSVSDVSSANEIEFWKSVAATHWDLESYERFDSPMKRHLVLRFAVDHSKVTALKQGDEVALLVDRVEVPQKEKDKKDGKLSSAEVRAQRKKARRVVGSHRLQSGKDKPVPFQQSAVKLPESYLKFRSIPDDPVRQTDYPRSVAGSIVIEDKKGVVSFAKQPIHLDKCHVITFWFNFCRRDYPPGIWRAFASSRSRSGGLQKDLHVAFFSNKGPKRTLNIGLYFPSSASYGTSYTFRAPTRSKKKDKKATLTAYNALQLEDGWHHCTVVSDGEMHVSRLYIDGVIVGTAEATCNTPIGLLCNSAYDTTSVEEKPFPEFADFRVYNYGPTFRGAWLVDLPMSIQKALLEEDEAPAEQMYETIQIFNLYSMYGAASENPFPKRYLVSNSVLPPDGGASVDDISISSDEESVKEKIGAQAVEKGQVQLYERLSKGDGNDCGSCDSCLARGVGLALGKQLNKSSCTFSSKEECGYCTSGNESVSRFISMMKSAMHCQSSASIKMEDVLYISLYASKCASSEESKPGATVGKRKFIPPLLQQYLVNSTHSLEAFEVILDQFLRACHLKKCVPNNPLVHELIKSKQVDSSTGHSYPTNAFISVLCGCTNGNLQRMIQFLSAIDYLCAVWLTFAIVILQDGNVFAESSTQSGVRRTLAQSVNVHDMHLARSFCSLFRTELTEMVKLHMEKNCGCTKSDQSPCGVAVLGVESSPLTKTLSNHSTSFSKTPLSENDPFVAISFFSEVLWNSMPCVLCNKQFSADDLVSSKRMVTCSGLDCVTRCHAACLNLSKKSQGGFDMTRDHSYFRERKSDITWQCSLCTVSCSLVGAVSQSDQGSVIRLINQGASILWRNPAQGGQNALHIAAMNNDVTSLNIMLCPTLLYSSHTRLTVTHPPYPHEITYHQVSSYLVCEPSVMSRKTPIGIALQGGNFDVLIQLAHRIATGEHCALRITDTSDTFPEHSGEEDELIHTVQATGCLPAQYVSHPEDDYANGAEIVPVPWTNTVDDIPLPKKPYVCSVIEHASVLVNWTKNVKLDKGCNCSHHNCGGAAEGRGKCYSFHKHAGLATECNQYCECAQEGSYYPMSGRFARIKRFADCGRRSIQNGVKIHMSLFKTDNGRGWGVRADQFIKAGEFLTEYVGELVSEKELKLRDSRNNEKTIYTWDIGYPGSYHIDATRLRGVSAFFNHACSNANVVVHRSLSKLHRDKHAASVVFFAARDIVPGEELTCDYKQGSTVSPWRKGSMMFKTCLCDFCVEERKVAQS